MSSSSESEILARALQDNLSRDADVAVWSQGVFASTEYFMESLLNEVDKSDFGIFVLARDDQAVIRGEQVWIVRDNVLFEIGLFVGRRGRERCFLIAPQTGSHSGATLHLPSNLHGISLIHYASEKPLAEAIAPVCNNIRQQMPKRRLLIPATSKTAIEQILQVAARLVALRSGLSHNEVRGFCHIFDEQAMVLKPIARYFGTRQHPDAVPVPCSGTEKDDWYIISRAFRTNLFCCEEVDWKANLDAIPAARRVWGDLHCVVAQPIGPEEGGSPIGTVAFDSSKKMEEIKWKDDPDLRDILALLSSLIFAMIKRTC